MPYVLGEILSIHWGVEEDGVGTYGKSLCHLSGKCEVCYPRAPLAHVAGDKSLHVHFDCTFPVELRSVSMNYALSTAEQFACT